MIVRWIVAAALLVAFGAATIPFQVQVAQEARTASFRTTPLDLSLREQIDQMGFLAALSGFRSPLAAFLWVEAHTAWENTEWGRMAGLFTTVTTLQPHALIYWDMAAWHMAWNASLAAMENDKQSSKTLRIHAQHQYFLLGKHFLEQGIRNNPDRYQLYFQLGVLLRDKFEDHCAAATAFLQASERQGAPPYCRRFAGYEMAKCPEREQEAYQLLKALYLQSEKQRTPMLVKLLHEMEKKLDIPTSDRLDHP